ncbi:hypothetical protein KFU94_48235 [Chloroflexi bacterium TSY]|nr:hypothetical protein [Chloroflexi bacterium TSY]
MIPPILAKVVVASVVVVVNSSAGGDYGRGGINDLGQPASGTDGATVTIRQPSSYGGAGGGGGGGGVIGGGGGGGGGITVFVIINGSYNSRSGSGAGGGVAGGGAGGGTTPTIDSPGSGGGGAGGVGSGGDGAIGGTTRVGSGGGDEGSAGGGGGAAGALVGGDDGSGGGGGGSWSGGGSGGPAPDPDTTVAVSIVGWEGGAGNGIAGLPVIPDSAHYLNDTNPRLMLGGAGGASGTESETVLLDGGAGGGIVFLEFDSLSGNGNTIRADGDNGRTPPAGTPHSGSGGGGGASGSADVYHGGVGGGGGSGIWFDNTAGVADSSNTGGQTVIIPNITWSVDGGQGGAPIVNPKNSRMTAAGGGGGTGLVIVSAATMGSIQVTKNIAAGSDPSGVAGRSRLHLQR